MEIITTLNQLSWPAAVAILGSVVTFVIGLFGYLRSEKIPPKPNAKTEEQILHARLSTLRDQVAALEGDIKALNAQFDSLTNIVHDHELRDTSDFRALSDKVEKIMQIIVEMLRDGSS